MTIASPNFKGILSIGEVIYESPDSGKTIYARKRGSSDRILVQDLKSELGQQNPIIERVKNVAISCMT